MNMSRSERKEKLKNVALTVAAVAGGALLLWGASRLVSGLCGGVLDGTETLAKEKNKKMMKAPGRDNYYIARDDFESDPKEYFSDTRNKKY
ncbi:hypothetical protein QJS04_geneDACA005297 [Acorus gramineus]|uniref:Uncharacterized protein n=1 Tax=Acorus gramineus TaxID=55184 RepID=A0AAV9AVB1_ACOGR|nr:hypothetical protein QJS04_geneDACA005297 [Acorus gramineus]